MGEPLLSITCVCIEDSAWRHSLWHLAMWMRAFVAASLGWNENFTVSSVIELRELHVIVAVGLLLSLSRAESSRIGVTFDEYFLC